MSQDRRWGALASWTGKECASRQAEAGLLAVRRAGEGGEVVVLDPAGEGVLAGLVERWLGRQIEAAGSSLTLTFETGSAAHDTIVAEGGAAVCPPVDDSHVQTRFTVLVSPDGHNAVAVTSPDGTVSHGEWESPDSAVKFGAAPTLIEMADEALTHLRVQLGLPTRPVTLTPLWDLLCMWADHVAATWATQVAEHGHHRAALAALDSRPDVVRTVVTAKVVAQQAGNDPNGVPWPSQRWLTAGGDDLASQVAVLDAKATDAVDDPWGTVQCVYESAAAQPSPYDGPALLRLGLLPQPVCTDPIEALSALEGFPDWLGESTVRVARLWL